MHLHVITHDVPFPPTYGGVIDVYFQLKALAERGIELHLHAFTDGRNPHPELYRYCVEVNLYPKRRVIKTLPTKLPRGVNTRNDEGLLDRLLADSFPILFEGIESTFFLSHPEFESRKKVVRLQRIDWEYYYARGQHETRYWQKQFYLAESRQLQHFEQTLGFADHLLTISPKDTSYYAEKHPSVHHLPPFHGHGSVSGKTGHGDYCLYHGSLDHPENHEAAMFLVEEVFADITLPLLIAGTAPRPELISAVNEFDHIFLRPNPGQGELAEMLHDAHIHVLPAFQSSGLPLKLIDSLYTGRFVLVNPPMVYRTGLEFGTHVAQDSEEMRRLVENLWKQDFTEIDIAQRKASLNTLYPPSLHGETLAKLLTA